MHLTHSDLSTDFTRYVSWYLQQTLSYKDYGVSQRDSRMHCKYILKFQKKHPIRINCFAKVQLKKGFF